VRIEFCLLLLLIVLDAAYNGKKNQFDGKAIKNLRAL